MGNARLEAVTRKLALITQRRSLLAALAGVGALRLTGIAPDGAAAPRLAAALPNAWVLTARDDAPPA